MAMSTRNGPTMTVSFGPTRDISRLAAKLIQEACQSLRVAQVGEMPL